MKNKKFMIAGLIIILVVGIVSVFAIGTQNKSWYGHKGWKKSGEHTYENFGDKSAWLEKLGLPSDATETQIMEAKKEYFGQGKADHMINIREKLGLPDDASEEEVQEAWQKWTAETKCHSKKNHKGSGFSKGSWCGQS